ncbi:MAG: 23S rRNA (adenine(2503)-C(2))-methyltransferase RlmN [Candidatus Neomarinimicrobiota bacterium]
MSLRQIRTKESLAGRSLTGLADFCGTIDQPRYRADQLFYWLYTKQVSTFAEMTNIPKRLRTRLDELVTIHELEEVLETASDTGETRKLLFATADGFRVESVLMQEKDRITVCLSTQVGCNLDCRFCATAGMGFSRNLTVAEIVDQFLLLQRKSVVRITNVVFMGMGEPFLNYPRVLAAADLLNAQDGINLGARKITISTAGIVPQIRRFTAEKQRYKLAVSLNAADQKTRLAIMPIAGTYPLHELMAAVRDYYAATHNRPTLEYVLLDGINDSRESALRLVDLIDGLPCKVNLIPYNDIDGSFRRPLDERIEEFIEMLYNAPFTVTVRWSKGTGIKAGCGQLAVATN